MKEHESEEARTEAAVNRVLRSRPIAIMEAKSPWSWKVRLSSVVSMNLRAVVDGSNLLARLRTKQMSGQTERIDRAALEQACRIWCRWEKAASAD